MGSFRRLTVRQSMALIFCAGLSVAVVFASASLLADLADRRALGRDQDLVESNATIGAVMHELQRERALTLAWLRAPLDALTAPVTTQRGRTDAVLTRAGPHVPNALGVQALHAPNLADRLAALRALVDARSIAAGPYRDAMSAETQRLIWAVARSAATANSGQVALSTNNLASLMAAKDAIGQERASGASILALAQVNSASRSADIAEFQRQIPITETWLHSYRLVAGDDARSFLELWERSRAYGRFATARTEVLTETEIGGAEGIALEDWVARADQVIDDLRAVEIGETDRIATLLAGELRAARHDMASDITLFALLLVGFGALAFAIMRRVDRSIHELIRTARRLSQETTPVPVPGCSQRDLDQIARALDLIRRALFERRVLLEAAEALRSSVGEDLDRVFAAIDSGATDRRVDVLGLDAHGAALARGVNQLLDRIENQERRDTGTL